MRLARAGATVAAAVLLVTACAIPSGDADGSAFVEQVDPAFAVTAPPVTAPPALRTVPLLSTTSQPPTTATSAHPTGSTDVAGNVENTGSTGSTDSAGNTETAPGSAPSTQTSAAPAADAEPSLAEIRFELVPVAHIEAPIALVARPGTGQRYVATLTGQVWLLDPDGGGEAAQGPGGEADFGARGEVTPELVADIGSRVSQGCENGLLGMAFSPAGTQLYLSYTDTSANSRIVVMPMVGDTPQTDRRRVLLALDQPACNHNGGDLAFGPDGNLWAGFGDGGGANDRFGHGQDRSTLLGTMVRIDPDPPSGRGYGIPVGNPFASGGGAPEVWAYGARNPWRFSFDRLTGDLWIADVGQNRIEEIHVLPAADGWTPGANLGWPLFEGNERFSGSNTGGETPGDLVFPVYTYGHDEGCSVTGGYVYRGSAIAALAGTYVFGDYCTGEIWGLVRGPDGTAERIDVGVSVPRNTLVSFGEDADGELYVLSAAGTVLRLESAHP
ncbi:PQQ-dependent sugar dehydrogenase [Candidatus Poriferisodalis sp.]|uniref:PQQ-dependent sugar dehydrogenase n=1 Tax=Candidatus Poriferisodalis sp. TaxID=3101277 RepID=UPI003B01217B